jgi:hypothetical protein
MALRSLYLRNIFNNCNGLREASTASKIKARGNNNK